MKKKQKTIELPGYTLVADVVAKSGLSNSAISQKLRAGLIPGAVKHGGKWYIPDSEVGAFLPPVAPIVR
jgi:hypothetical protein